MKIKVLYILNNLNIGGVQSFCINIFNNIDKNLFQVDFMVEGNKKGDNEDYLSKRGSNIFHNVCLTKKPITYIKNYKKILHMNKYDVVHVHMNYLSIFPLLFTPKKSIRICHAHASYEPSNLKSKIFRTIFRLLIKNCTDFLLGCSDASCKWLYHHNKYLVIPNGIDTLKFKFNNKKRIEIRNKYSINKNALVFINVASLSSIKRQFFLINSFKIVNNNHNNSFLFIVGDGPELVNLKKLAFKLEIEKKVIFVGQQTNVQDYLSASDLFVFASLFEGFPISVLEACSNGLKCLVSKTLFLDQSILKNIVFLDCENNENYAKEMLAIRKHSRSYVDISKFDIKNTVNILTNIYCCKVD